MKNIKRLTGILLVLTLTLFALAACGKEVPDSGACKIVLSTGESYSVPLDKVEGEEGLISVLNYLKQEEKLEYTSADSGYGAYLTSVGGVREDGDNGVYLYIWTSVEADFDVSEYASTMEYEGKTLTSSGVGASQMTFEDGAVIYIGTVQW